MKPQPQPKRSHEVWSKVKLKRRVLASGADGGEGWRDEQRCCVSTFLSCSVRGI